MSDEHVSPGSNDLRDVEEHFSQLVSGVQDYAIFMLSPSGHIKTWNEGARRIKGYEASEIIGKHFSIFYTDEANARRWPQEELVRAGAIGRFEDEGLRVRKDGTLMWASVVITPLYDPDGSIRGFLKITRDLTERKQAEEEVRQGEQRFRLLVEGVKDYAIFVLDTTGRVASWNTGAQRIKGYSAEEIIGQHFSRFYTSEDVAAGKPANELVTALAVGSVEDEGWRVRKDGSLFWANVVITAIFDEKGVHIGFTKVTRDLTEKKRSDALEAADRQKNEFLAMLAHELRNPLAPISNGLQLLKLPNVDMTVVRQTADLMERQLFHLVRLVDDLLDISRVITGKMTFKAEPSEIASIVTHAVEETQSVIDARGHELMLSLPARSIIVDADAARLAQVISNLLVNAAKYTEQPSRIWLTVEREDDEAVIRVKDSGIGISPEVLPKIFSLFVQADSSLARSQGGLGIGLTIVKRIIEAHRGTVSVTSAGLGHGSEFTVRLPISAAFATAKRTVSERNANVAGRRILVVDDNVDAANTTATLLRAWGHEVQTAYNGPGGLEASRSFRPEIVLLDIGLPGMSGYDVAKHLRADPLMQGIVLAALTGYGQESDRQRAFDAGFDFHLTKPPDPDVLENVLSTKRPGP